MFRTFIWLGPQDDPPENAISFLDHLQKAWLDNENDLSERATLTDEMWTSEYDQVRRDVKVFLSRPWFHRTWTFQEIILAPMSIVACGFTVRSWDIFRQACLLCDIYGWPRNMALELGPILDIGCCPQKFDATATDPSRSPRLLPRVYFSMVRKATDPRDKVYALISRGNSSN